MAAKPYMRVSGGNPAGMPDFRPINPWGRMPVMPAKLKGPVPVDKKLCQIFVKQRDGKLLPIGPKAPRNFCERLLVEINSQIAKGRETVWSDPEIVEVNRVLS